MNMIKKFAYITLQLLTVFPFMYAAIRYRDVNDFDAYYHRMSDWFDRFVEEKQ